MQVINWIYFSHKKNLIKLKAFPWKHVQFHEPLELHLFCLWWSNNFSHIDFHFIAPRSSQSFSMCLLLVLSYPSAALSCVEIITKRLWRFNWKRWMRTGVYKHVFCERMPPWGLQEILRFSVSVGPSNPFKSALVIPLLSHQDVVASCRCIQAVAPAGSQTAVL